MHILSSSIVLPLLLAFPSVTLGSTNKPSSKDAILLSKVKTLTLRAGRQTSHRRVPSVPQVSCVGGTAAGLFEPSVVRCTNDGAEYSDEDIQWTCTASLPDEFHLGATDVVCEGYRNAEDDWVLKGSCAVEYRLELTAAGKEKWPERVGRGGGYGKSGGGDGEGSTIAAVLFWCFFLAVLGWIIFAAFIRDSDWWRRGPGRTLGNAGNRRPPGGGGGGGGGGGWWPGGGDDPPPPYEPYDTRRKQQQPSTPGWRPGFWTGAASGAAGTMFANSVRNNSNRSYNTDPGPSTSGASRRSGGGSSGASPSYSSTRHESTGFGGTRRR